MEIKASNLQGGKVSGTVQKVSISGCGPNSAEIVAAFQVAGEEHAYAVYAYPSTEPSVFTSFANLLVLSHLTRTEIDLTWVPGPGPTPQITEIDFPSAKRSAGSDPASGQESSRLLSRSKSARPARR